MTADDTRALAIEVGARAVKHLWGRITMPPDAEIAAAVVDAVTPIIRDHDPLCSHASPDYFPRVTITGKPFPCDCPLIARVRADERERMQLAIAQEIEADRDAMSVAVEQYRSAVVAYNRAASIARGGAQ